MKKKRLDISFQFVQFVQIVWSLDKLDKRREERYEGGKYLAKLA